MSAVLNTNIASLWASKNLLGAQNKLAASVERLSSGLRINRARDDAAGLGVANSLTAQINGANQGIRNLNDAISMVQTAEGAIAAASEMGQRILMLATQGANGTLGTAERSAIQNEMKELLSSIGSISGRTVFSGNPLLAGDAIGNVSSTLYSMQISNSATDVVALSASAFLNVGGYAASATAAASGVSSISMSSAPPSSIVGSTAYIYNAAANSGAGSFTTLGVKVTAVSGTTVTFSGNTTAAVTASAGDLVVFSGQTTERLSSTSGDGSLWEAVYSSGLTSGTANTSTQAFQMVQRAANSYVIELGKQRSQLGAYQNQMEYTLANITNCLPTFSRPVAALSTLTMPAKPPR